jgi:hypothetical protein
LSERHPSRGARLLELQARRAAQRVAPAPRPTWPAGLAEVYAAEQTPQVLLGPAHVQSEIAFRKWRVLHKFLHDHPFDTDANLPREAQWRAVAAWWDRVMGDPEVAAWIDLQAEVAANLAKGIRDLRPRKDGPCYPLLREFVSDRKRKANAVHRFALAAKAADPAEDWDVTEEMIERWRADQDSKTPASGSTKAGAKD